MDIYSINFHIDNIRIDKAKAINRLADLVPQLVNPKLDIYYLRGFSNERWYTIISDFANTVEADPLFTSDAKTKNYLFGIASPIMISSVRFYYKTGVYPIDGIVPYAAYKKMKAKSVDWYYHVF